MTEPVVYQALLWSWLAVAAVTVVALCFLSAPYGRHARAGWGPALPSRWGWILMEMPAALGIAGCFALRPPPSVAPWIMLALWEVHYVNRAVLFRCGCAGAPSRCRSRSPRWAPCSTSSTAT